MQNIPIENQRERELVAALELLSPGTSLREGIDYIIQGKTGALIVVGDTPEILSLTEGGFRINSRYTPMRLYELAKMDGAIILSENMKRIVRANVTLRLNPSIDSRETGLRHRAADKFAQQTGHIVLAVSRSRNTLSLYLRNQRYIFRERPILISGANQTMLALTQYIKTMQNAIAILNWVELSGNATLADVITTIQLCERVRRTEYELTRYRIELGTHAQSLQLMPSELMAEIERGLLVIKDYYHESLPDAAQAFEKILRLDANSLASRSTVSTALGYPPDASNPLEVLEPRGYRMLSQIPHIPLSVIENIVQQFKRLEAISAASVAELEAVADVGKARATAIKEALVKMKTAAVQPEIVALSVFE